MAEKLVQQGVRETDAADVEGANHRRWETLLSGEAPRGSTPPRREDNNIRVCLAICAHYAIATHNWKNKLPWNIQLRNKNE